FRIADSRDGPCMSARFPRLGTVHRRTHAMKKSNKGRTLLLWLFIAGWVLFFSGQAAAQEKHRYFFKTPSGVTKYTQQHVIDVGDVPGHQVRVFEQHSKYTGEAPAYDGVKAVEVWFRGLSGVTNGSGHGHGYGVTLTENGDKIFGH